VASGPYPGTFTESVTYSFGPGENPSSFGVVTSLHATFTITSATGTVSGTKDLAPGAPPSIGSCLDTPPFPTTDFLTSTQLTYHAAITSPSGQYYTDAGTASAENATALVVGGFVFQVNPEAFQEQFLTSTGVAAANPQTKDDCKNGGYVHYGYRNQGQCVAAVNHQD